MCLDKNKKEIKENDYICLEGMKKPFLVISKTSLGIYVDLNEALLLEVLKFEYKKISNTIGFIPIVFLMSKKILICPASEYPECYI